MGIIVGAFNVLVFVASFAIAVYAIYIALAKGAILAGVFFYIIALAIRAAFLSRPD